MNESRYKLIITNKNEKYDQQCTHLVLALKKQLSNLNIKILAKNSFLYQCC